MNIKLKSGEDDLEIKKTANALKYTMHNPNEYVMAQFKESSATLYFLGSVK